ncbi:MAG: YfiR family protein [Bacteroidetes bacterium]|nr:MAG: YfiR family protein [Bacteroidota bacterium]
MILIFVLIGAALPIYSQDETEYDVDSKKQAIFIYNFMKYIDWPKEEEIDTFKLGVYQSKGVYEALVQLFKARKAQYPLKIRFLQNISEIGNDLHLLYVTKSAGNQIDAIKKQLDDCYTLLITDENDIHKSMINFIYKNERMRFELNLDKLNNCGYKTADEVINMANEK